MQFGNWKHLDGKELYVGCTVVVRSYARVILRMTGEFRVFVGQNADYRQFFNNGYFCANTQAVEWAIVNKPKIEPALGMITEFLTNNDENGRTRFTGKIYDQENDVTVTVPHDIWPTYNREPVEIKHPVVINWIHIEEPFNVFYGQNNLNTLLPLYANYYLTLKRSESQYWLGWVDTRFSP